MKNALLAVLLLGIVGAVMVTPSHAAFNPVAYARTDKPAYSPGDSGTLYITIRNLGTQAFTIKNISITYPWFAFVTDHWDGNTTTILNPTVALASNQNYNTQFPFTVPTDGRVAVAGGSITLKIGTDIGSGTYIMSDGGFPTASIAYSLPTYQPLNLASSVLAIVQIILLGIAIVVLFMVYLGISKLPKK